MCGGGTGGHPIRRSAKIAIKVTEDASWSLQLQRTMLRKAAVFVQLRSAASVPAGRLCWE